jgi:hypothetical protein
MQVRTLLLPLVLLLLLLLFRMAAVAGCSGLGRQLSAGPVACRMRSY